MKKSIIYLLASVLLHSPAIFAAGNTVTILADYWYPISGNPHTPNPGYMVDLAEKVFAAAGMSIDYQLMPWTRAINAVQKGEFDCVLGTTRTNTPDFIFPTQSWGIDTTAFFVKKNDGWQYQGLASLEKRKVGLIQDYLYGDQIDSYIASHPANFEVLSGQNALSQNIRKLLAGRIDTILDNPMVVAATLKQLNAQTLVKPAGNATPEVSLDIACSPHNRERSKKLIAIIDEQTKKLRANGEMAKILAKYDLQDWQ